MVVPDENELPSHFADKLGLYYSSRNNIIDKRKIGQFLTPLELAHLMARMSNRNEESLKILDPGCGCTILSCSVIEYLIKKFSSIKFIELELYELDFNIIPYANKALTYLKIWAAKENVNLQFHLKNFDFLECNLGLEKGKQSTTASNELYDIVISNPPFFKISKKKRNAIFTNPLLINQPNIYSIFLTLSVLALKKNGELIFITPRSFSSGKYYKSFREFFFHNIQVNRIHVFHSRKQTFVKDKVLQETIIIKALKKRVDLEKPVTITNTFGLIDIEKQKSKEFALKELIDYSSEEKIFYIPTSSKEEKTLSIFKKLKGKLWDYKINVSTGPVVYFRAIDYIESNGKANSSILAPLIWLNNISKMEVIWPINTIEKGQFIKILPETLSILIPNKNYVFIRRFSTKDDKSRLIASPFLSLYNSDYIGVENRVNYIYRLNGSLSQLETIGISALLNSDLYNTYFRIFNGSVNVSATELREMPFPDYQIIEKLGKMIIKSGSFEMEKINSIIDDFFQQ